MERPVSTKISAGALLLAALVGACSGTDTNNATADRISTSDPSDVSSTPPSTPSTTTTTSATTSTLSATTSSSDPTTPTYSEVETAVREAHTRFMTVIWANDDLNNGIGANQKLIEQYVIDPQKARMLAAIEDRKTTGQLDVGPGYDSNIMEVVFQDDVAFVVDCSLGRGTLLSPEGEMLIPAATVYKVRETQLVNLEGQWMVEDFRTGGDLGCNPDGPPWDVQPL